MGKTYTVPRRRGSNRPMMYRIEFRTNHLALGMVKSDAEVSIFTRGHGMKNIPVHIEMWPVRDHFIHGRGLGKPTVENIERWRARRNASMMEGGTNYLLTRMIGSFQFVTWARIVRRTSREVVAEWTAPTFEVM